MPVDPFTLMTIASSISGKGGEGEGGGIDKAMGSGIGTGIGVGQVIAGAIQRRKAKKLFPDLEDTQQVNMQQDFIRRANNAMTGTGVSNQMRDLLQTRAGAVSALGRTGDLSQYGQLARIESQKANDLLAQGQQTELAYRGLAKQTLDDIVKRRFDLNAAKYAEMKARAERNTQSGYQNMFAGLMRMAGGESEDVVIQPETTMTGNSSVGGVASANKSGVAPAKKSSVGGVAPANKIGGYDPFKLNEEGMIEIPEK